MCDGRRVSPAAERHRSVRVIAVRLDPSDEYMYELGPRAELRRDMYLNCVELSEYLDQIVDGAPVGTAE
jgi:hypothetical protein